MKIIFSIPEGWHNASHFKFTDEIVIAPRRSMP